MGVHELPRVSIIIPCRNEERHIADCLDGVLASDYPRDRLEVLVVDGCSDDRTAEIARDYAARAGHIRLLTNPLRITPAALNLAVREATGELVLRMDAHSIFPPTYVGHLVRALLETGAELVGGAVDTQPGSGTPTAQAIALAMRHPFGMGNSAFRIGTAARRRVDHVPFFCCRRALFDRVGHFDEELVRNEDGEFSSRVLRHGGAILLVPEARATYRARDTLGKLARTFLHYGYYKMLTARKVRRIMTIRQLVPPIFVLAIATTSLVSLATPLGHVALTLLLGSYAGAVVLASALAGRGTPWRCIAALLMAFPIMHVCHGVGQLRRAGELALGISTTRRSAAMVPLNR